MFSGNSGQDWNTVVINKNAQSKKRPATTTSYKGTNNETYIDKVMDGNGDMSKHTILNYIPKDKSKQIQALRLSMKMNQKQFGGHFNMPHKDIVEMENGKYLKSGHSYSKMMTILNRYCKN